MPMDLAFIVRLRGALPQAKLEKFRELLQLTPRGRLDDDEDSEFGYKYVSGTGADATRLSLSRRSDDTWIVILAYGTEPLADGMIEQLRADIAEAAKQVGLTVERVVQHGEREL